MDTLRDAHVLVTGGAGFIGAHLVQRLVADGADVHVLTSVDYSKMSDEDKAKEPAATKRTDADYALCWIRREGKGRLFYEAHGHSERVYAMKPMLEHLLAGIQYAIGDLKADDTPGNKAGTK